MKVFYTKFDGGFAVASGFNRGHAVKLISKELEASGFSTDFTVEELDIENKKGNIAVIVDDTVPLMDSSEKEKEQCKTSS